MEKLDWSDPNNKFNNFEIFVEGFRSQNEWDKKISVEDFLAKFTDIPEAVKGELYNVLFACKTLMTAGFNLKRLVFPKDFFGEIWEDFRMINNLFALGGESAKIQTPVILNSVTQRLMRQFMQ